MAARALHDDLGMDTQKKATPAAVVAIDFSDSADVALDTAFELAATRPDITLHVVSVASGPQFPEKFDNQTLVDQYLKAEETLATKMHEHLLERRDLYEKSTKREPSRVAVHPRFGDAAKEIVEVAAAVDADLVVMGTHGRQGLDRALLGSVAEKVVRTAGCPVQVVRPKEHEAVETPLEEVEPPPRKGQGSTLGRRHTYHYVPRSSGQAGNMPLVYQDPVPQ